MNALINDLISFLPEVNVKTPLDSASIAIHLYTYRLAQGRLLIECSWIMNFEMEVTLFEFSILELSKTVNPNLCAFVLKVVWTLYRRNDVFTHDIKSKRYVSLYETLQL